MIVRRTERLCFNRSHLYTMKKPFTAKIAAGASFRKIYSMRAEDASPRPWLRTVKDISVPSPPFRIPESSIPLPRDEPENDLPPAPADNETRCRYPGAPRKREHLSTNGRYLPSTPARLPPAWPSSCRNARYCGRGPPAQVGKAVLLPQLIQDVIGHRDELLVVPLATGSAVPWRGRNPGASRPDGPRGPPGGNKGRHGTAPETGCPEASLSRAGRPSAWQCSGNPPSGLMAQHQASRTGADLRAAM